jgi:hypothetical protein
VLGVLVAAGCGSGGAPADVPVPLDAAIADDASVPDGPQRLGADAPLPPDASVADGAGGDDSGCVPPTGPDWAGCGTFFCGGTLRSDWLLSKAATGVCTTDAPYLADELYAMCDSPGSSPSACVGLAVGQEFCHGGVLTALCMVDDDCPAGAGCVQEGIEAGGVHFGTCEKRCSTAGNGECGLCGIGCDLPSGFCVGFGPGYPTNVPCDDTHAAIAITLDYTMGWNNGRITLTIPGAAPVSFAIRSNGLEAGSVSITWPYPSGATAGPATAEFRGDLEFYLFSGTASFSADPTQCTRVTVQVTAHSTLADAGP